MPLPVAGLPGALVETACIACVTMRIRMSVSVDVPLLTCSRTHSWVRRVCAWCVLSLFEETLHLRARRLSIAQIMPPDDAQVCHDDEICSSCKTSESQDV